MIVFHLTWIMMYPSEAQNLLSNWNLLDGLYLYYTWLLSRWTDMIRKNFVLVIVLYHCFLSFSVSLQNVLVQANVNIHQNQNQNQTRHHHLQNWASVQYCASCKYSYCFMFEYTFFFIRNLDQHLVLKVS